MTFERVTEEYVAERPLPVALWLAAGGGVMVLLTTTFIAGVARFQPAWPKEIGVLIGLLLVSVPTTFFLYSASVAVRWVALGAGRLAYPIPSKAGVYRRNLTNENVRCLGTTARWVCLRFGWGVPYAFPRSYQRLGRRYELTVKNGVATMTPVNGD